MTTLCPCCGQPVAPVYCAASTDAAPLLLAWTLAGAGRALGVTWKTIQRRSHPWRDGVRLSPHRRALPSTTAAARARLVAFFLAHPAAPSREAAAACGAGLALAQVVRRELVEAGHIRRRAPRGSQAATPRGTGVFQL